MTVAKTEDVADHAHDGSRAGVVGALVEPRLAAARLEPQNLVQVISRGRVECVLEDLDLLNDHEMVVVRRHSQHEPVLDVERDLARVAVLADEVVQRVRVGHPPDEARIW